MARGATDYSNVRVASPVHQVSDLGELAVRLGSASVHDRAGNVTLADSLEFGNGNWLHASPTADSSQIVSPDFSKHGHFSLKLTPASSSPYGVHVARYVPYTSVSKLGAEISFTVTDKTQYIYVKQYIQTGDRWHRCEAMYDDVYHNLYVLDDSLSWLLLDGDVILAKTPRLFHTLKMVCDPITETYDRLLLDSLKYEGLGVSYYAAASSLDAYVTFALSIYAEDASQPEHYVDSLILTQNEP